MLPVRFNKIKWKMMMLFVLIGIVPLFIIGSFTYWQAMEALKNRTFEQLYTVNSLKKKQLQFLLDEIKKSVTELSQQQSLKEILKKGIDVSDIEDIVSMLPKISELSTYSEIAIIDTKNNLIRFSTKDSLKTDFIPDTENHSITAKALPTQVQFHDYSKLFKEISISVPVLEQKKISGYLIFGIPDTIINACMHETSPRIGFGESGESYIIGKDLLMRSSSRFDPFSVMKQKVESQAAREAVSNNFGNFENTDYRGVQVLSSTLPLQTEGLDWIVITEIDTTEVLAPMYYIRKSIILAGIILTFLILVLAIIFAQRITTPIIRLRDAALQIGKGDFELNIEPSDVKDEIGELSRSFVRMAEKLKLSTEEMLQREDTLRHFHDATNDGILLHDKGFPLLVNQALCDMTGYTQSEIIQLNISNIVENPSTNEGELYETLCYRKDHSTFHAEVQEKSIEYKGRQVKAIVIRDITQRKKIEETLQAEREERFSAVVEAEELERKRLSRELHDSLGQLLIAIKLKLESIKDQPAETIRASMEEAQHIIDTAITEVRAISDSLMPVVLYELGLETALKRLCNKLAESSGKTVEFDVQGSCDALNETVETYLFRIAQEALSNAVKYSQANEIRVQLIENQRFITMHIEDNGIGFNPDLLAGSERKGIYNMRERVSLLNGIFELYTSEGKGTLITVKIPLS